MTIEPVSEAKTRPEASASVFIAGSITITRLHPLVGDRIASVVDKGMPVVVGDANGADTAIQQALLAFGTDAVTVYCSNGIARNNVGNWPLAAVETDARPGSRAFFTAKDRAMAEAAGYGLMIWDAKSTGTLSNVIALLEGGKTSVVFIDKDRMFATVNDPSSLRRLVDRMSASARAKADEKMNLSAKLDRIDRQQFALI